MSTETVWLYLVELGAYDPVADVELVLRYATGAGFVTAGTDTPAHTVYLPAVAQAIDITRSMFAPGTTHGRSKLNFGDVVLRNPNGELDALLGYAMDGRDVVVKRAPSSAATLAEFDTIFVGTQEPGEFTPTSVVIRLRDQQATLDAALVSEFYGGTNALPAGVDGSADLTGKPKPFTRGSVRNVSAPLVNTSRLIYQVNDGAVADVTAVRDRGVALAHAGTYATLADLQNDALAPAAGTFKVYDAGGLFRLGSRPAGTVTADVLQGVDAAARSVAQVWRAVLLHMGVDAGAISSADVDALDVATDGAVVGVYVDDATRAGDVLDALAGSVGAWWGLDAAGVYRIGQIVRPNGVPTCTITERMVIGGVERVSTADAERGLPARALTLSYAKNYTPQDDLAGAVDDATRADLAQGYREVSAEDDAVAVRHRLAVRLFQDTLLAEAADAARECARRFALRKVQRHRFNVTVPMTAETNALDLGHIAGLLHSRYGLTITGDDAVGQLFVVLGVEPRGAENTIRFTLWGNSFTTRNIVDDTGAYLVTDTGAYLVTDMV